MNEMSSLFYAYISHIYILLYNNYVQYTREALQLVAYINWDTTIQHLTDTLAFKDDHWSHNLDDLAERLFYDL